MALGATSADSAIQRVRRPPFPYFYEWKMSGVSCESFSLSYNKGCPPTCVGIWPATLTGPEGERKAGRRAGKGMVTSKAGWGPRPVFPPPTHCFLSRVSPPPPSAPVSLTATVKVSGWPEPDRTGRRLGRVKRKRAARWPRPGPAG